MADVKTLYPRSLITEAASAACSDNRCLAVALAMGMLINDVDPIVRVETDWEASILIDVASCPDPGRRPLPTVNRVKLATVRSYSCKTDPTKRIESIEIRTKDNTHDCMTWSPDSADEISQVLRKSVHWARGQKTDIFRTREEVCQELELERGMRAAAVASQQKLDKQLESMLEAVTEALGFKPGDLASGVRLITRSLVEYKELNRLGDPPGERLRKNILSDLEEMLGAVPESIADGMAEVRRLLCEHRSREEADPSPREQLYHAVMGYLIEGKLDDAQRSISLAERLTKLVSPIVELRRADPARPRRVGLGAAVRVLGEAELTLRHWAARMICSTDTRHSFGELVQGLAAMPPRENETLEEWYRRWQDIPF